MLVNVDVKLDVCGMVIKLMKVEGEKIVSELKGVNIYDFIMINIVVFFNCNIFDYVDDMKYLVE